MKDALGYYEILQVSTDADNDTIKHAYRDLAKIWHPDSNRDENATDIFQKLSTAYDVVGNPQNRLVYDILSLVYTQKDYPDIDTIVPYTYEDNGTDVKVVNLRETTSMLLKFKQKNVYKIATYKNALLLNAKVSLINWLFGWWHFKGFARNIQGIINNLNNPVSQSETLKIMLHNMIAYAKESKNMYSAKCGLVAKSMLNKSEKELIDKYILNLGVKVSPPKRWNDFALKSVQLIIPLIVVLIFLKFLGLGDSKLWQIFNDNKKINYYQTVNTGYGKSVDDVVVGKVVSIPLDKSDKTMLYHLTEEAKVMYGPSKDFDVLKILKSSTTVRLTGYTPDKEWARVMIDNGESGFIKYDSIKQGIGKEIPYGSSIIE